MAYWKAPQQEKHRAPHSGDEFVIPHANLSMGSVDRIRQELIRRDPSFIIADTKTLAHAIASQQVEQEPTVNTRQALREWADRSLENATQPKTLATEAPIAPAIYDPIESAKQLVQQAHELSPNTTAEDFDTLIK